MKADCLAVFRYSVDALAAAFEDVKKNPPAPDAYSDWAMLGMLAHECWSVSTQLHQLALSALSTAPDGEGCTGRCGPSSVGGGGAVG